MVGNSSVLESSKINMEKTNRGIPTHFVIRYLPSLERFETAKSIV